LRKRVKGEEDGIERRENEAELTKEEIKGAKKKGGIRKGLRERIKTSGKKKKKKPHDDGKTADEDARPPSTPEKKGFTSPLSSLTSKFKSSTSPKPAAPPTTPAFTTPDCGTESRSPSMALQGAVSSTLSSMSNASFVSSPVGPDTYVVVRWGPSPQQEKVTLTRRLSSRDGSASGTPAPGAAGGEWVTDMIRDNCNPIWTGIGGGEIILHRKSAFVDGHPITVMVFDEVGLVGSVVLDTDTGIGRVVHSLGGDRGGVAVEVKVPSGQEMEDGRRTRQWKLDHASATSRVLQRMEKETVGILKTVVAAASPVPNTRWSKDKKEREFKIKPWMSDKQVEGRVANTWWTKAELKDSIYKPTEVFFPTSSPASMEACNATLKIEVLHCVNLPNADGGAVGTLMGKKTDAFVAIIIDDNFAQTSVINNCLSPICKSPMWEDRSGDQIPCPMA
jgi:hypothetical protein